MTEAAVSPVMTAAAHAKAEQLRRTLETLRGQLSRHAETVKPDVPPVVKAAPSIPKNPNRPTTLDDMIGQHEITMQLRTVIAGARLRQVEIPHVLISGASGFGKTTLAEIIASEVGAPLISTTGMVIRKVQDLVGLLVKTAGGPAVLFIDEVHALNRASMECLYTVLEDAKIGILSGSGADTEASTQPLPHLVIVCATTAPGKLTVPFRDRFGVQLTMEPYSDSDLSEIVLRFWRARGLKAFKGEAMACAVRSKGTPRRAITLATRVLDYMAVQEQDAVTTGTVSDALSVFGLDGNGLDGTDYKILRALTSDFVGRTVGLDSLAVFCDLDPATVAEQIEPYLVRRGLILKTGRGRTASAAAYELMRS